MTIRITPPRENIIRAAFTSAALRYMTPEIEEEVGRRIRGGVPKEVRPTVRVPRLNEKNQLAREVSDADKAVLMCMPSGRGKIIEVTGFTPGRIDHSLNKLRSFGLIEMYGRHPNTIYHATGKTVEEAMAPPPKIDIWERRMEARRLHKAGVKIVDIAARLGISYAAVKRDLEVMK